MRARRLRAWSRVLTPGALTILRVVVGFILAVHGWQKLSDMGAWEGMVAQLGVPAPQLFAVLSMVAELGGGIALMLGLLTPLAALAILVNMLVAIFVVHAEGGLLANNNGFEYPLTIASVALFFLARGAGPISLDHAFFGRRREARDAGRIRREEAPA